MQPQRQTPVHSRGESQVRREYKRGEKAVSRRQEFYYNLIPRPFVIGGLAVTEQVPCYCSPMDI